MAVDLGGTNFRVCSIRLHGNTTFSLTQSKVPIPRDLMVAPTASELFAFLAKQIEAFLKQHHGEHYFGHLERVNTNDGGASRCSCYCGDCHSFGSVGGCECRDR